MSGYAVPALGDVDGDGDADLVCGEQVGGQLTFFENLGGGNWATGTENYAEVDVLFNSAPALRDMDGDGDLDLLVGGFEGCLVYAENTGTVTNARWVTGGVEDWQGVAVGGFAAPAVGDLNGDNLPDVLTGNADGRMSLLLNSESGYHEGRGNFDFVDVGEYSVVTTGDLDGDGDYDVVAGRRDGTLSLLANVGSARRPEWEAPQAHWAGLDVGAFAAPWLYDLNGDGLLDLIIGNQTGAIAYYRNTGTAQEAQFTLVTNSLGGLPPVYRATPCLLDADSDGDGDLVVGEAGGTLIYCENSGSVTSPTWGAPVENLFNIDAGEYSRPACTRLRRDGLIALVVGAGDGTVSLYANDGTSTSPLWQQPRTLDGAMDVGYDAAPCLADMDDDGDPDLLIGEREGGLNFWRNTVSHMALGPRAVTLFEGDEQVFSVQGTTSTSVLEWSILSNRSGSTLTLLTSTTVRYVAGPGGGLDVYDTIEVRDVSTTDSLYGRSFVNVLDPEDRVSLGKAVICAGRRDGSDSVWGATRYLSELAYKTLRSRGYTRDDIYYLSPVTGVDVDGDGNADNDIDALATVANLESALTTWASGTHDLVVYLVDHGWVDEGDGEGRFGLDIEAGEVLEAPVLDGWLDGLQSQGAMKQRVLMDCCYAGSFLPALTAPEGQERIVATACSSDQVTFFVAGGLISFSESFWNSVLGGSTVGQAFGLARDAMDRYQQARLDETGDGVYEPGVDGAVGGVAWNAPVGIAQSVSGGRPEIGRLMSNQALSDNTTTATLWVADVSGSYAIDRVWAVVVPPDFRPDPDSDDPVLDLPRVDLEYFEAEDRWQASYGGFDTLGSYKLIFYAVDIWDTVSIPKQVYLHKMEMNEQAILVVGATPYGPGGSMQASYRMAGHVLRTLENRGFPSSKIRYLSDESGNDAVDGAPTRANVEDALENWAGPVAQLTLWMVAEGTSNSLSLNAGETLSATELGDLVGDYQARTSATVVVVLECTDSGSFLDELSAPDASADRVILTSTLPSCASYCIGSGVVSFSHFLFSKVFEGRDLEESYDVSRDAVRFWTRYRQTPGLDDNGDGVVSSSDGSLARSTFIGAAFLTGGDDLPRIGSHSPSQELAGGGALALWAANVFDSDGVASVRAVVVPQAPLDPNDAVEHDLILDAASGLWEAEHVFAAPASGEISTYTLCFTATDRDGNESSVSSSQVCVIDIPATPTPTPTSTWTPTPTPTATSTPLPTWTPDLSRFDGTQACAVSSDGHFYAAAYNLTMSSTEDATDAYNSGSVAYEMTAGHWFGVYVYDYAQAGWAQALYVYDEEL